MKKLQRMTPIALVVAALLASGCSTTAPVTGASSLQADLDKRQAALDTREASLNSQAKTLGQKEASLSQKEVAFKNKASTSKEAVSVSASAVLDSDLLPPDAKKGECFARVWQAARYKTVSERVLVRAEDEKITIIPAKFQWQNKVVEVKGATSKLITKPAVYGSEKVTTLVRDERTLWRESRSKNSSLVTDEVVEFAKKHSTDDIAGATLGTCFHEHRKAPKYKAMDEKVLVSEAYDIVETIPAQYKMVNTTVVVSEASTKIIVVPATYKTETQKILVKPATTVWKKGSGPIQKIDSATGEIMCLVDVPAEYKTVTSRVIDKPSTTKTVTIPQVIKTIKVRQEVAPAKEVRRTIPAKYKMMTKTIVESDGELVWHEVHNNTMNTKSRTGRHMCLVNEPAIYKTTTKRIVLTPASTQKVVIPAVSQSIKVKTLVSSASEKRTKIPAVYKTITRQELVADGSMEWRSILCETNMTRSRIKDIQSALKEKGYNPGPIDGVVGSETISAMNKFQKANKLPIDRYLNVESIRALGVSEK
jgi:outer membrane murein-binding lipoprotein Lpp